MEFTIVSYRRDMEHNCCTEWITKLHRLLSGYLPFVYRTQSNFKFVRMRHVTTFNLVWSTGVYVTDTLSGHIVYAGKFWSDWNCVVKTWGSKMPVHTWYCHKIAQVVKVLTKHDTFSFLPVFASGHAVVQLVEVLCYKLQGHGFDSGWCHWILHFHNPSGHTGPGVDSASNRNE
jgi:hypothetical protein